MARLEIRIDGKFAVYEFDDFAKIDFGLERELQKQVTVLLGALYKLQEGKNDNEKRETTAAVRAGFCKD